MIKTEKLIRVKSGHGRNTQVLREHYVRDDVPCNSELCQSCSRQQAVVFTGKLPDNTTHYLIPDYGVAKDYGEVLELGDLTGIILLQSVAHHVLHQGGGRQKHSKLQNMAQNAGKGAAVFANEFCSSCYQPRKPGQSAHDWQTTMVYNTGVWYYNHLQQRVAIVIVTTDPKMVEEFGSWTSGVFVMTLERYLLDFWPNLTTAHELYHSLSESLALAAAEFSDSGGQDYSNYLSQELLTAGLRSARLVQGSLHVNKHRAQLEAFLQRSQATTTSNSKDVGAGSTDILISGTKNRNRAVHGDVVVVELLPKSQWVGRSSALSGQQEANQPGSSEGQGYGSPCGRVVGVVQRRWRDYVASFPEEDRGGGSKVLVIPWDYRVPKIRISTRQAQTLKNQRIVVRLDSWEVNSQYPNGHFVRSLGAAGQLETEVATILIENQISALPFSQGMLRELPVNSKEIPWEISEDEVKQRRDLRKSHLIFSIDPPGCEDVDDALSVKQLKNGNIQLGVHIADVTHFVKPNSLTDLEAKARATTVYLADRRYDMLPGILSADLCSLLGGVNRYAVSVLWELDPSNYDVIKVWYGRTIIKSSYKMVYEAAQALFDGKPVIEDIPELQGLDKNAQALKLSKLHWCVEQLTLIARRLREKRTLGGALELEGVEVKVQLNQGKGEEKSIEDLIPKQPMEVHETVAELMIFANHWVAKKIFQAFSDCSLLRHHPLPRQEQFGGLVDCAASRGLTVQTASNKSLAQSLDRCVDPGDPSFNRILRMLATQAMSNALYFSTGSLPPHQFYHYGLALDYYTHFTSPIRRYADIIVHRLLLAAVQKDGDAQPQLLPANKELQELCDHINQKNRASQQAQKISTELFQTLFFRQNHVGCVADAVVYELRPNGVLAFVPRYGLKGPLYLKDRNGLVVNLTEGEEPKWESGSVALSGHYSVTVTSSTSGNSFSIRLFDHLTVGISVVESHAHPLKIRLDLLANKPHGETTIGAGATQTSRSAIVQEVTSAAEERQAETARAADTREGDLVDLETLYGQTSRESSLYTVLERFKEMSLLMEEGD